MSDDTDDQFHEDSLLASAYLDGEASSDERALVETSPESLTELEEFSQLRQVLAATAPVPSLSEREANLADALDVWERMSDREHSGEMTPAAGVDAAAAAALTTPTSTSEGRRARGGRNDTRAGSSEISRWVLGAAAAVVVLVGAAAAFRSIVSVDDGPDEVATDQPVDDGAVLSELEANEAQEVAGGNVGGDFAPNATDLSDDVASDPEADGALPAADAMEESAADDAASAQPAPAPEIDRVDLASRVDLADYGSLAVRRTDAPPAATTELDVEAPGEQCEAGFGIDQVLEPARYRGQDVIVGVDLDDGIVYAYTEDCTLVQSAPLP